MNFNIVVGNSANSAVNIVGDINVIDLFSGTYLNYLTSSVTPSNLPVSLSIITYDFTGVNLAPGQTISFNINFALNGNPPIGTSIGNYAVGQYSGAAYSSANELMI